MKIRPMGAQFQADGRTDGRKDRKDEAISCFRNFANAPKYNRMTASSSYKLLTLDSKCCTP